MPLKPVLLNYLTKHLHVMFVVFKFSPTKRELAIIGPFASSGYTIDAACLYCKRYVFI